MQRYVPAKFKETAFNCPLCSVYSEQDWNGSDPVLKYSSVKASGILDDVYFCICLHCKGYSIWVDKKMVYPRINGVPFPHPDMPVEVKKDYEEARAVVSLSPRSAAALIRRAIEELVNNILGREKGKDLNESIGVLVKKGLPNEINQSLDFLRVTGNSAVHPLGIIDVDDYNTAVSLFGLVNLVVEDRIANPKRIKSYYDSLPQSIRDSVDERDGEKNK